MTRHYDCVAQDYAKVRRPDPRIDSAIREALGSVDFVVNVGAGTGSYEPPGAKTVAVEPSNSMISMRAPGSPPAVRAVAEALPFRSEQFDAAMAVLTLQHWPSLTDGLRELRRVSSGRIVIVTWDPSSTGFWLVKDYLPEVLQEDRLIFPTIERLQDVLGPLDVTNLPVPHDCSDGFLGAYWRRPEAYLENRVTIGISAFARVKNFHDGLERLQRDLVTGRWHDRYGELCECETLDIGYRILVVR